MRNGIDTLRDSAARNAMIRALESDLATLKSRAADLRGTSGHRGRIARVEAVAAELERVRAWVL